MKTEKLMLHDLVEWNGIVCEVTGIYSNALELWDRKKGRHYYVRDGFNPIALTEEIFALNGWKRTGYYGRLENPEDKKIHILYEWNARKDENGHYIDYMTDFGVNGISGFRWVHEFQDYLRLVERDEKANNFKV